MYIVGAGMAGCLAGVLNPTATIYEAAESFQQNHDAVLRFRDDQVSKQVGIPFKKVKVRKGIYATNSLVQPSIKWANMYSVKVTRGKIMDRSIWDMEASTRYVAPSDFHEMLADMCGKRILYNSEYDFVHHATNKYKIVSTIPMNKLAEAMNYNMQSEFKYQPIRVDRFKISDCDVYQTIYFPAFDTPIYRMTLTGEDLIVESIDIDIEFKDIEEQINIYVENAFGIPCSCLGGHKESNQRYGKIEPIDDRERKQFMYEMTTRFGIYSLGRFATWRNILLDDVLNDIFRIREMMNGTDYDFVRKLGNGS
jgi:hypothetical protein